MAKVDPEILAHLEWIGFVRPTGLVVSAPALARAGAILDRRDTEGQRLLRACVEERTFDPKEGPVPQIRDFRVFAKSVLGWSFSPKGYAGTSESPIPAELEVALPDSGGTLRPDFAVRELDPKEGGSRWQLLVQVLEAGQDFDRVVVRGHGQLEASAHGRMERLLRQTGVPAGLLFNGRAFRLVSAPRGESSGWMDFRVAEMVQTAGRPISTALRLLLGERRLLSLPRAKRLTALLDDSRKYQNDVSEKLAEQVLHALYELLRGFQAAHDASKGGLLREPLTEHPDEVYRALLTVILRLVFLLYAEERDMLPVDETFLRYYSLAGLYERLREDAALFPDTMDQRYGAWAQLLVLFRMIHDGAESGPMRLPKRHGVLFDPDRYKFLEGRTSTGARQLHERIEPPLVPDGTIYRSLDKLLVLDGERISYRALDVEQIGSVYETMMGFRLETATGRSVAIRSQKKQGAPTAVDIEALLREPGSKRDKWIQDRADRKLTDTVKKTVADARTAEDLHAALLPVVDLGASPDLVPNGAMVLQPSEERRRSGSHYTPRLLTEPIVRTTLEPILARLRGPDCKPPSPAQILDLKVCDPAMGSGAFLVEACRQLGDALVESWHAHGQLPAIPPDEDEVIFARRLIAQRCLYGVDKNAVAVDLAKVSLWLVTLAKDHPLTFVDHALRHGDSLVGLSKKQIQGLNWDPQAIIESVPVDDHLKKVAELRKRIREADESVSDWQLRDVWDEAQFELGKVRLFGDLVLAAFFEAEKAKDRERKRSEYAKAILGGTAEHYRAWLGDRRHAERPLVPFHWEIELPEVFERDNGGFDAIVGNPPFLGGKRVSSVLGASYKDYLVLAQPEATGNTDLSARFLRRAFDTVRHSGAVGLIATNTIAQGDTRRGGLKWICEHGGEIYACTKRYVWPSPVSVVVSIVHFVNAPYAGDRFIDGHRADRISAYLFHAGGDGDPEPLGHNEGLAFIGCDIKGQGFLFDDADPAATPTQTYRKLVEINPKTRHVVMPYMSGEEINESPTQSPQRWVINFGERDLEACKEWPELLRILEEKVRPERQTKSPDLAQWPWWRFWRSRRQLYESLSGRSHAYALSRINSWVSIAKVATDVVYSENVVLFVLDGFAAFALLQSCAHEVWARFFSSTALELIRYSPSNCFETFPFPDNWQEGASLEASGRVSYEFRASLMIARNEGLTKTYNRFHDPDERDPDIVKLRELHAAMDRAVLDAYGWKDVPTDCEFLLEYEIDEEEWGTKKKPYRYRWPDGVRDEVLARLLELNAQRAAEEARSGAVAAKKSGRKSPATGASRATESGDLFS